MSKAEALLKVIDQTSVVFLSAYFSFLCFKIFFFFVFFIQVILSPVDSVANTYRALLPEGTPLEFQRILELKVGVS